MSRSGPQRQLLGHLRPDESAVVLERLLEAHGDLATEAEELAVDVLQTVDAAGVSAEVVETFEAMDFQEIGGRVGHRRGWGYVDEGEAGWQLLNEAIEPFVEEILRRGRLGFPQAAAACATAVLAGLEDLRENAGDETVLGWSGREDTTAELAYSVLRALEEVGVEPPADIVAAWR